MKSRHYVLAGILAAATGIAGATSYAKAEKPNKKAAAQAAAAAEANKVPAAAPASPDAAAPVQLTKEQSLFFEAKVRPVLAQHCYKCHSVTDGKAKGGLVVDTKEGWMKGGSNGAVITPGDPGKSRLIQAVAYNDPDLQMPPKGEKMTDKEIADLTAWVKMGAPDPRTVAAGAPKLTGLNDKARAHWAFQPVKEPAVPQVKDAKWVKTPVDSFVLAKLEQNGMHPAAKVSKESLIRRATYDLVGLPPTPEEVRAFVNDQAPDAFDKVVDRLLASPHYGERWGRFWLDTARYSDTTGDEKNNKKEDYRFPYAWTYRDYVINAFNNDKPFDQFLKEQIAADLLPVGKSDPNTLAALGFLTVGKRFQNPNDTIDERIDCLGKSTMGLTIACARCHDHKFDPIPTADYYSLHGIFNSIEEPIERPMVGGPPSGSEYADYQKQFAELEARNRELYYKLIDEKATEFRKKASAYLVASYYSRKGDDQESLLERNEIIAANKLDRDIYQGGLRNIRKDQSIIGPLERFSQIPRKEFAAKAKGVLAEITTPDKRHSVNPLVLAAFKAADPESIKSLKDVTAIYGKLFASIDGQARAYLNASRSATNAPLSGWDPAIVELINIPAAIEPAVNLHTEHLKKLAPLLPVVNNKAYQIFQFGAINELQLTHPGAPGRAMIVADEARPRDSYVMIRGEKTNKGPVVPRQFLEILSPKDRKPFTQGSGRLELAESIANKNNPLTARVAINRLWMHHFGEGFVRTVDDVGVQSDPPTHPELLDYLAARFVEDGWSFKKIHRTVMLSNTYQQSSDTNALYAQKDPANRLLWRSNLRRLDFEAIRDSILQFTGKMDDQLGGKPVNLTDEPYSNRRSVYGYIDRGNIPELMSQFDFSDPDMTNSHRTSTIVPQQALFFMNSPMAVDVVRKVTSRDEFVKAKDDRSRIKAIYEVLFQRQPRAEELRLATDFLGAKGALGKANAAGGTSQSEADQLSRSSNKAKPANKGNKNDQKRAIQNQGTLVERRPLTAWEEFAQALLFTNEIAYVN